MTEETLKTVRGRRDAQVKGDKSRVRVLDAIFH